MEMTSYSRNQIIPSGFDRSLFKRFIDYTDVKDTTIKGYTVCIRSFIRWMNETGVRTPNRADIMQYKLFLSDHRYSAGTQRQYLRAVKHFFKWTAAEGLFPNIADNIKGAKVKQDNTRKDPFTESEIITVINSIDTSTVTGKRDKAVILLAVTCGLRIIEMQRADIGDIVMKSGERVIYIQGKGHDEKDDYKKIVPEVWQAISDYLKTRPGAGKKDPLFASTSNRSKSDAKNENSKTKWTKQKSESEKLRISEPTFSTIIKDIFRNAGFDSSRLTAHSLRHTSVTMLLKSGASLQEAQAHARHADPKTTTIYAHNIDKAEQHPEKLIYDHLFSAGSDNPFDQAMNLISSMTSAEAAALVAYLKAKGA